MTPEFIESEPLLSRNAPMRAIGGRPLLLCILIPVPVSLEAYLWSLQPGKGVSTARWQLQKCPDAPHFPAVPVVVPPRSSMDEPDNVRLASSAGCGPPANSQVTRLRPEPDVLSRCAKQARSLITSFSAVWRWKMPFFSLMWGLNTLGKAIVTISSILEHMK